MRYLVSRTYSETTPESAADGDCSDNGFVFEDMECELFEVLRELRDCSELSQFPVSLNSCDHVWASTEYAVSDYADGTERQESVHIKDENGCDLSSRRLFRIFQCAGLAPVSSIARRALER